MPLSEFSIIRHFFGDAATQRDDVLVGIGDDCAVTRVREGCDLVTTTDTLVAGVHFPDNTSPRDIGYKSLAVSLSDLASMGATPAWVTLALTMPEADRSWLEEFSAGFFELAAEFGISLIGGDTTRGPLSINVQAQGLVPTGTALLRGDARAGDRVYVSGTLGDAGLGLKIAAHGLKAGEATDFLLGRLRRPTPRVAAGRALRGLASACIDISDGLLADLAHIMEGSDLGAEICVDYLPRSKAFNSVASPGTEYWHELPLNAGDDYELCFCVPPAREAEMKKAMEALDLRVTPIGLMTEERDLFCFHDDGEPYQAARRGYRHF